MPLACGANEIAHGRGRGRGRSANPSRPVPFGGRSVTPGTALGLFVCAQRPLLELGGDVSRHGHQRALCARRIRPWGAPGGKRPVTAPKQKAPGYRHFTDLPCHLQTSISHRNRGASPFLAACKLHTNVLEQKVSTDFHLPLQPRNYTKPMHYASHLFVPSQGLNPV